MGKRKVRVHIEAGPRALRPYSFMRSRTSEESVVAALQAGPKESSELLAATGLSKRTLFFHLGRLEKEGRLIVFPLRQRDRWVGLYALPKNARLAARISKFQPLPGSPRGLRRRRTSGGTPGIGH